MLILVAPAAAFAEESADVDKKAAEKMLSDEAFKLAAYADELREKTCPKQTSPQLCQLEFNKLTLISIKVDLNLINAIVAYLVRDNVGYQKAMSDAASDLDKFRQKFEELVAKYGRTEQDSE